MEEGPVPGDEGSGVARSLAGGRPVEEFSFWDREGDSDISALFGNDGEEYLEAADVPSMGSRCDSKGQVVDIGEHDSSQDHHVKWGDLDEE